MTAPAVQSPSYDSYTPTTAGHVSRISSLDFVKGLVMVIMAIDHVRVYAGVPAGGPPPSGCGAVSELGIQGEKYL